MTQEKPEQAGAEKPRIWGYNEGIPEGVTTAWGCRAIAKQAGAVLPDPNYFNGYGPQLVELTQWVKQAWKAWQAEAERLLRIGEMSGFEGQEFVLFQDERGVIKGNTRGTSYVHVCAYFTAGDSPAS